MFSSKLEIIRHFDNLIQRVDIDIEESLKKYNQEQVLGDLSYFKAQERNFKTNTYYEMNFFDDSSPKSIDSYQKADLYSESTKVIDYLNQVRMRTIDELRKAQEDTLDEYTRNKTSNNQLTDELKSQTFFPDKFYFQVLFKPSNEAKWIFNLFTFVTDFYLPQVYIDLFEKLINTGNLDLNLDFWKFFRKFEIIFDEKMVLIGLLQKYFFENLQTEKYPSHVIRVCKQDTLNIKQINFSYDVNGVNLTDSSSIDLLNLQSLDLSLIRGSEDIVNIEGLSSLQSLYLVNFSPGKTSLKGLNSLRELSLISPSNTNNLEHLSELFEYFPNIEKLCLSNELSYINLDSLVNLKSLRLVIVNKNTKSKLNIDLFKNISHQLEEINICFPDSSETIEKLFDGHKFSNLLNLEMSGNIKFGNRLFSSFPTLQNLNLSVNQIRIIDNDTFSNMKQLISLDLYSNHIESISKSAFSDLVNLTNLNLNSNCIETIDENLFSNLNNLQILDLSSNELKSLDPKSFCGLVNLRSLDLKDNILKYFDLNILDYIIEIEEIDLSENPIAERIKDEILDRFNGSKIKFFF